MRKRRNGDQPSLERFATYVPRPRPPHTRSRLGGGITVTPSKTSSKSARVRRRRVWLLGAVFLILSVGRTHTRATGTGATIYVNENCTLEEAIYSANLDRSGKIVFDPIGRNAS